MQPLPGQSRCPTRLPHAASHPLMSASPTESSDATTNRLCPRKRAAAARYRAQAWSPRDRRHIRKTFPTFENAEAWRDEAHVRAAPRQSRRIPAPARSDPSLDPESTS